jgi:site-specific DNA-cytosine methylase
VPSITAAAIQVGVAEPFVTPYYGGGSGLTGSSVEKPLDAVTTKARFGLVEPVAEPFVISPRHGREGGGPRPRSTDNPLPTITSGGSQFGVVQAVAVEMDESAFARALAQDRVIEIDGVPHVIDILFRMLKNHELAAAMSFSDAEQRYEFAGTQEQVTRQIGNAVPVRTAKALICAIMGVPVDDAGQAGDVVEMAA